MPIRSLAPDHHGGHVGYEPRACRYPASRDERRHPRVRRERSRPRPHTRHRAGPHRSSTTTLGAQPVAQSRTASGNDLRQTPRRWRHRAAQAVREVPPRRCPNSPGHPLQAPQQAPMALDHLALSVASPSASQSPLLKVASMAPAIGRNLTRFGWSHWLILARCSQEVMSSVTSGHCSWKMYHHMQWYAAERIGRHRRNRGDFRPMPRPTPGIRVLNVRLPEDLHAELKATAERQGVSLNQLVVALLAGSISWRPGRPGSRAVPAIETPLEVSSGCAQDPAAPGVQVCGRSQRSISRASREQVFCQPPEASVGSEPSP